MTHWQVGPYVLSGDGVLRLGGGVVSSSPLQRRLLLCFVRHAGQLIERPLLLHEVWGHEKVSDVSVARAVHSLRQLLARGPLGSHVIRTSYGSGYVFTAPVSPIAPAMPEAIDQSISTPSSLALEYYFEARAASRHFDPLQLERSRQLLQRSLQASPNFREAILFLVSVHLDRGRWGLVDTGTAGAMVEALLHQAEQLGSPSVDLLALRAETTSLLHWQPVSVDKAFGGWLPQQLSYGPPLLAWVRHLLARGRAEEGMRLLEPKLDASLPMGWFLAAQLIFQLGQVDAAMEMLRGQLRIDGSLPCTHLFLSVLQAHVGDRAASLRSLAHCRLGSRPFQGFQAGIALALAMAGEIPQAEALLAQAKGVRRPPLTMLSVWALTAIVLGQRELADNFFTQAVQERCFQAPFLAQSPLLEPYAGEACVQAFRERMARAFPASVDDSLDQRIPLSAVPDKAIRSSGFPSAKTS